MNPPEHRNDALDGVRVIEVSQTLRAAFAGATLRDLGARVVRVNLPDEARTGIPRGCDQGKTEVDHETDLAALCGTSDILIEDTDDGWPLSVAEAAGGPLVVVSVTGLGRTSTTPNPPELCVQAASGAMWSIGVPEGAPQPVPAGVAATLAGVHAANAAIWLYLAALGETAPRPAHADIAEADVIATQTGTYQLIRRYQNRGAWDPKVRPGDGGPGADLILGALVPAADGQVYVQINSGDQLERLHALLPSGFAEDIPTYADGLKNKPTFIAWVAEYTSTRTRADLLHIAERAGLVAAVFLDLPDLGPTGPLPLLTPTASGCSRLPIPWALGSC